MESLGISGLCCGQFRYAEATFNLPEKIGTGKQLRGHMSPNDQLQSRPDLVACFVLQTLRYVIILSYDRAPTPGHFSPSILAIGDLMPAARFA